MNGAGTQKRRSARLSAEGVEDASEQPPQKKTKVAQTVSTKTNDGGASTTGNAKPGRRKKVYDQVDDEFMFSKGSKRGKGAKAAAPASKPATEVQAGSGATKKAAEPEAPTDIAPPKTAKKAPRRMPDTPERDKADRIVRRSKRISDEHEKQREEPAPQHSPIRPSHAKSHRNAEVGERSPSPEKARPVTVEKKRRRLLDSDGEGGERAVEEKTARIALPFADTPVIKRNKEMRKASADMAAKGAGAGGSRRTSSGMRGKRASSLMEEGKGSGEFALALHSIASPTNTGLHDMGGLYDGVDESRDTDDLERMDSGHTSGRNPTGAVQPSEVHLTDTLQALPHPEVPTSEFYKHISADLTEPRRMRCLLGWCGNRALPPKPSGPTSRTPEARDEFQALQAARVIQAELSQDLVSRGILSDWFSRDESTEVKTAVKKAPNPRNVTNAGKAEELEAELERLKQERAQWDALLSSNNLPSSPAQKGETGNLSPIHEELLSTPDRDILNQLNALPFVLSADADTSKQPGTPHSLNSHDPASATLALQSRLQNLASNLEFNVDSFYHGVHAVSSLREEGDKLADRVLSEASNVLEKREQAAREKVTSENGKQVNVMDALRGLGKVLNPGAPTAGSSGANGQVTRHR